MLTLTSRKSVLLWQVLFLIGLVFIKVSNCLTLLRIAVTKWYRTTLWVLITVTVLSTIFVDFYVPRQFQPIAATSLMVRGQSDLCVRNRRRQHQSQVYSGGLTNSLDNYTMAAIWSNIQAVVCLVCCCAPVYKPILPGPNFWENLKSKPTLFFVRRERYRLRDSYALTSTAGAKRREPSSERREQGWLANDDGSSLGLVWAEGQGRPSNSSGSHEIVYPPEAMTVERDQCRRDSSWV